MAYALYAYVRGQLTIRRILIYAPPVFLCVLTLTYVIYLFASRLRSAALSLQQSS
jgi:hypothetical protein